MVTVLDGERRWTTILTTDMVAFSTVSERIGAERVYGLMNRVIALAKQCVVDHGGCVVDTAGDGVLAAFGAPVALEHGSLHACRAARAFHQALSDQADALDKEFGVSPQFRTGISGGEVVFGSIGTGDNIDHKVMGDPVNIAARLESQAEAGEILISDAVLLQVEGFVLVTDLGKRKLKGFRDEHSVYRLDAIHDTPSRFEGNRRRGIVNLISRDNELTAILDVEREETVSPRFVSVNGSAGIGKSRLIHEFAVSERTGGKPLVGQCNPNTEQIAFVPLVEIISQAVGLSVAAQPSDFVSEIENVLGLRVGEADMAAILSTARPDTAGVRDQSAALNTREVMHDLIVAIASHHTLIIEDAHWMDTLSGEVLERISRREVGTGRIVIIITHRPEFIAQWQSSAICTRIDLAPLHAPDIADMARRLFDDEKISDRVIDLVVTRSEGNPLFAEEVARFLRASGELVRRGDQLDLNEVSSQKFMTGNLQHLIQSRFDALPDAQKPLMQIASAIGRNFSASLLAAIAGDGAPVEAMCRRSLVEGLIEEDPGGGDDAWRFSHALMRDAVYGGLLSDRRTDIHGRIAAKIMARAGDNLEDVAETLAFHFSAAKDAPNAVRFLALSAQKSYRIYAVWQLDRQLSDAFDFIDDDPSCVDDETYGDMVLIWLRAMEQAGNFRRLLSLADRLMPHLQKKGYSRNLAIAQMLCSLAKSHARDYAGAKQLAAAIAEDAAIHNDEYSLAWVKVAMMRIGDETDDLSLDDAIKMAAEIEPVAAKFNDAHMRMLAYYMISSRYRSMGKLMRALEMADKIDDFGREHGDRRAKTYACWARGLVLTMCGQYDEALRVAEFGLQNSLTDSSDNNVNRAIKAAALLNSDRIAEAQDLIAELETLCQGYDDFNMVHLMYILDVQAKFRTGQIRKGWRRLTEVIPILNRAGNISLKRYGLVLRGEVLMSMIGAMPKETGAEDAPRPKLRPLDVVTALSLRVFGRKRAIRDFEAYRAGDVFSDGAGQARALINLGILYGGKHGNDEARKMVEEGRRYALAEQVVILSRRADLVLANWAAHGR